MNNKTLKYFSTLLVIFLFGCSKSIEKSPNIVFILTDDLAYADLSSYGSEFIETPNLDKMADDGVKMTSYYAAQAVCSASRAAILTGCYPNRLGISGAFGPKSKRGINPEELLLSEMLKKIIIKLAFLENGIWEMQKNFYLQIMDLMSFMGYFFLMTCGNSILKDQQDYPDDLMLYRNETPIQSIIDQSDLTKDITDESIRFIEENKDNQFFLYIAHPQPHVPLFASKDFNGSTGNGLFADVISEIDFSVGRVIEALEKNNLTENTIVVFTSDNGPWLSYGDHAGSSGIYREGKGTAWEGGQRVPCIIKYPKEIKAKTIIDEPVMGIDWMPTFSHITGSKLSTNKIDGKNIWPLLTQKENKSPHKELYFYYRQNELHAVRSGDWKLYFPRSYRTLNGKPGGKDGMPVKYENNIVKSNELYNLKEDPSETTNVYWNILKKLKSLRKWEKMRDKN